VGIFPALLDRRPSYLDDGSGRTSLLLAPLPTGSLICELHARLETVCHDAISVVATFEPSAAYTAAIRTACSQVTAVMPVRDFVSRFASYDLKDWLVIVDPACFPLAPIDWRAIENELARPQAAALHIVALDENPGGTTERVQLDAAGKVRRIQRYYDAHTWAFTRGIACSIVPAAALVAANCSDFTDLRELRRELMLRGVPSRDLPLVPGALDLENPRALLHLAERCLLASGSSDRVPLIAASAIVDRTAQLVGPVFVHDDALVEAGARVIGPTVIGRGARIGERAVVAQCLVAPGTRIAADSIHRHAVLAGSGLAGEMDERDDGAPLDELPYEAGIARRPAMYPRIKAVVEPCLAAVAVALLLPLLALVALIIKLESRGPILYGDSRETIGGRSFRCWKFRTMCTGAAARQREMLLANEVDGPQFKMEGDPRVTRVGAWLRQLSLDELPQLLNIVRGDMSLVGPRPSPFRENQICIPWREARLSVRAGITGLWQVCRAERSAGDFHQWIHYDLLYVRNQSFLVDLRLVAATCITLVTGRRIPASWVLPASALSPADADATTTEAAYDSARA
jgi:lipopolysaccharide/colanic/teichoic acid biosynthesis glycosyltransferase/acetyltransferase-like isoleucine patch superfamily enzyme